MDPDAVPNAERAAQETNVFPESSSLNPYGNILHLTQVGGLTAMKQERSVMLTDIITYCRYKPFPFYRWRKWGAERLNRLSVATEPGGGRGTT